MAERGLISLLLAVASLTLIGWGLWLAWCARGSDDYAHHASEQDSFW